MPYQRGDDDIPKIQTHLAKILGKTPDLANFGNIIVMPEISQYRGAQILPYCIVAYNLIIIDLSNFRY